MLSTINIKPEITQMLIPLAPTPSASAGKISYMQGYGQLSKAGATVQIGVIGNISIDLTIESLSKDFYRKTTDEVVNKVSSSIQTELKEKSLKEDYKNWWFAFLAGSSQDKHNSDFYKNYQQNTVDIADTTCYHTVSSNLSSYKQLYHVSGNFQIIGQSYIETTVYLFIETLTIQTSEGSKILIPTQNTVVADANGNTGSALSPSKINIVPLS